MEHFPRRLNTSHQFQQIGRKHHTPSHHQSLLFGQTPAGNFCGSLVLSRSHSTGSYIFVRSYNILCGSGT